MVLAYLALGSNLGNKEANLEKAVSSLEQNEKIKLIKKSSWLKNPAIEAAGTEDFLNGVVAIETSLEAQELLSYMQEIEKAIDPERDARGRKGARYIDLDILLFGSEKIKDKDLEVPHPRMLFRDFVMKPLLEIEPNIKI